MNPSDDNLPKIAAEVLDFLVDGELPDARRREVLASLDRTAGGWRACALAFLEAQCVRESLGKMACEPVPRSEPTLPRPARRNAWARHAGTFLAMAASFLVALGIGWWAGGPRQGGGSGSPASGPAANLVATQQGPAAPSPAHLAAAPMMTLALPAAWGEGGREIQVPVVERDQLDHSLLYPDAQAFPTQLGEALRRAGYQVRQSHELLPVPVQDGRHAILPVDQLDVHYVGNHVE
jgi:hypothetical protein